MNYFDTKLIHIVSVVIFFMSMTVNIYQPQKKLHHYLTAFFSILSLISGILLLRRFGIGHTGPFPAWVLIKAGIWLATSLITLIVIKKFSKFSRALYWPWIILIFIATALSIYKPL